MNQAIATLKTTVVNPVTSAPRREAATSLLRAIAADPKDPRATEASLVLRELNLSTLPVSTDAGQTRQAESFSSGAPSEQTDAELLEMLLKYPLGEAYDLPDPMSPECEGYYTGLLRCIYGEQDEPGLLQTRMFLYKTSRHAFIRERAFQAIAAIAYVGDWPWGRKAALAFIQKELPSYTKADFIAGTPTTSFAPQPN